MDIDVNKIQKVIFEVNYYDQTSAVSLQNKIISVFNNQIKEKLDKKLQKIVEERILKVKNIKIDLGTLTINQVENNFAEILEIEIENYFLNLRKKIEAGNIPSDVEETSIDELVFDYLYSFLNTGIAPWNLQELGMSYSIEYWIDFLARRNKEHLYKLSSLFNNKPSRQRLLLLYTKSRRDLLIGSFFPNSLAASLKNYTSFLNKLVVKFKLSRKINQNHIGNFILLLGHKLNLQTKNRVSTSGLADEFIEFINRDIGVSNIHILSSFIGITYHIKETTQDESTFINRIEAKYIAQIHSEYNVQIYSKKDEAILPLANTYFNTYLKTHNEKYLLFVKTLSERVIEVLLRFVKAGSRTKLSDISRGIIIDSIKSYNLPDDSIKWFEKLLTKLTIVFGIAPQKELSILLGKEIKKITNPTIAKEFSESLCLTETEFQDGGRIFKLDVQQGIKYFELVSNYGLLALKGVFTEPADSFEKIILWLKQEHVRYFEAAIKKLQERISPLHIWRLNTDLSQNVLEVISLAYSQVEPLGKAIFLEIIKNGFIPTQEFSYIGIQKIRLALKLYFQENHKDIEVLINQNRIKFSTPSLYYIKSFLDAADYSQLNNLLERDASEDTLEPISGRSEPDAEFIEILLKLQEYLPYLYDALLLPKQDEALIEIIENLIDTKDSNFAAYLISLSVKNLGIIKEKLRPKYVASIEQLLVAYKQKYGLNTSEILEKIEKKQEEPELFRLFKEGQVSYIVNAGLIILNPYITTLFTRLNLVENKKFIGINEQIKAMQLLQYIVNKNDKPEEPELLLNKVLVGVSPDEPIQKLSNLSNEEKDMCDGLLNAIIKNWPVLKSTTIDNLRASFLMRNGKLSFEEANWRLKVEQKSIDVLIDKMPWSVSMIKLPWMKFPLLTEWR